MQIYHFTEMPYPDAWNQPFLRVDISNAHCDPEVASRLYNRYLDEHMLADELGMNVMVNEHHSTSTCLASSVNVMLAILARQTKKARILALGVPLANRTDPLRVAEELSIVDVISGGRLEMGFVKGVPYEIPIANTNPVRIMDRFWEAHDFVLKAMTSQSGPYSWQGEYYQYRSVNIWPRPLQRPHPPVWITALSPSSAPAIAERGHVIATVLGGYSTRDLFDRYRQTYAATWGRAPARDRFAYLALTAVASDEKEALRRGAIVREYLLGTRTRPQFQMPPGYFANDVFARFMKEPPSDQRVKTSNLTDTVSLFKSSVEELIEAGVLLCGTPDQVYEQIVRFDAGVGGIGNLMLMAQASVLTPADTADSLTLFAKEVMPRLKERFGDITASVEAA